MTSKNNKSSFPGSKSSLVGLLSKKEITLKAREVDFEKQANSKIKAHSLLLSFFMMLGDSDTSYSGWATFLTKVISKTVSKQAIFKRMNAAWVKLVKLLLIQTIEKCVSRQTVEKVAGPFKNIYVQDSTSFFLSEILRYIFPGSVSKGKQKAIAKINAVINISTGVCCHFGITGFTTNEQSLAGSITDIAQAGDLVIRDMGYFVLDAFRKMQLNNIFYISRLKYGVHLFKGKKKLDLSKLLKNKSKVDMQVLCGAKERLSVRLVAVRLSPEKASERTRKAKKDRDRRLNHTKEYYASLHYYIFITNVECDKCNTQQIAELYRTRWRIEILFKSWKSGFKIEKLMPQAINRTERIESIIYMFLLYIAWFEQKILAPLRFENISILKLVKEVVRDAYHYLTNGLSNKDIRGIIYRCKYETRDRVNDRERLNNLIASFG